MAENVMFWKSVHPFGIENLQCKTIPKNDLFLPTDFALVKVKSIGVNFADVFTALGLFHNEEEKITHSIPGLEFSGIIEQVNSSKFKTGDRVCGFVPHSAFQTHITVPVAYLYALPSDWTFEHGASFLVSSITAWYSLVEMGQLPSIVSRRRENRKTVVFIHSGTGSFGLHAIQICKHFGAEIIATVGEKTKAELLLKEPFCLNENQIIIRNNNTTSFEENVKNALSWLETDGIDMLLDTLGGDLHEVCLNYVNMGAVVLHIGNASTMPHQSMLSFVNYFKLAWSFVKQKWSSISKFKLMEKNLIFCGVTMEFFYKNSSYFTKVMQEMTQQVKFIPPLLHKEMYLFEEAPKAIKAIQSGKTTGKVVIKV